MNLPNAKNTDIIVQSVENELLVYNLKTNKAYNLNETSTLIYQHCDGKTNFADLKLKYRNLTDDIIYFALDELKANSLIESEFQSVFTGISRRDVIKKVGLATMMALPIITSITAPKAIHAQSGCSCPSTEPVACQFGGNYSIGCYPDNPACLAAGAASGGNLGAPNHCCAGQTSIGYVPLTGCCTVSCRNPAG